MAPEQLRGEDADVDRSLLVGVVLRTATSSCPFPETFAPRLIDSILLDSALSGK
jgi:hypothetical protein